MTTLNSSRYIIALIKAVDEKRYIVPFGRIVKILVYSVSLVWVNISSTLLSKQLLIVCVYIYIYISIYA